MNFVHDQSLVRTSGPVSLWRARLKYSGQNSLDPKGRFVFARLFASASLEGMGPAARSRNKHSKQNQTVKPRQNYEADSDSNEQERDGLVEAGDDPDALEGV